VVNDPFRSIIIFRYFLNLEQNKSYYRWSQRHVHTHTKLNIPFLDPTISDKNKELATRFDDKISQCLSKNSILSVYLCDYRDACIFCLYRERIELCIYFHRIFFIKVRSFSIVELLHEFLD